MPIDPSIALSFRPTQFPGFDLGNAAQGANALAQFQANQQKIQSQNALRSILSQPGAIDDQGNPTADALKKVNAVDPMTGMQLRDNMLVAQQKQLQMSVYKTEAFQKKNDMIYNAYGVIDKTYQDKVKAGLIPEQQAREEATREVQAVNADWAQGGGLSEEEARRLPTEFEPVGFKRYFDGSDRIREWAKSQSTIDEHKRAEAREDASLAERERHDRASENAVKPSEVEIMTDPNHIGPDGKLQPIQFLYDKVKKQATTLTGEPYTPTGAEKLGGSSDAGSAKAERATRFAEEKRNQQAAGTYKDDSGVYEVVDAAMKMSTAAGAKEKDFEIIANDEIAQAERTRKVANGPPLSEADKAKIRINARKDNEASISDEAAVVAADRVLAGDERATVGMARSAANIAKLTNIIAQRAAEKGMDGTEIARRVAEFSGMMAGERTLAIRSANMEIAANEVNNMAPLALAASEKVDRTRYPSLNAIIQAAEKGTGDKDVVRFGLAANSLIYTYSKFLNPTGVPTDADKARAAEILSTAWDKGQFRTAIEQMKVEINSGKAAVKTTKEELGAGFTGKPSAATDGGGNTATKIGGEGGKSGGEKAATTAGAFPNLNALPAEKREQAIAMLKADEGRADQFDEIFGPGAAEAVLGHKPAKKSAGGGEKTDAPATGTPAGKSAAAPSGSGKTKDDPIAVSDPAAAMKLPPGTFFLAPDGKIRQRPIVSAPAGTGPLA